MDAKYIIGFAITGSLGLIIIIMSIVLMSGRGAFLIAGFNTMSKAEKAKYDSVAIAKFAGKLLFPIGLLCPLITVAAFYKLTWLLIVSMLSIALLIFIAGIYANTGNRFKKPVGGLAKQIDELKKQDDEKIE